MSSRTRCTSKPIEQRVKKTKRSLIEKTRDRLRNQARRRFEKLRPPRCTQQFFGREDELHTLVDYIQLGNSVVISGVGGIGKSELLLQALRKSKTARTILWFNIEQYKNLEELTTALRTLLSNDGITCEKSEISIRLDDILACVVFASISNAVYDASSLQP